MSFNVFTSSSIFKLSRLTTILVILALMLIPEKSWAQDDMSDQENDNCFTGNCLLCHIGLNVSSERVKDLIASYDLKSEGVTVVRYFGEKRDLQFTTYEDGIVRRLVVDPRSFTGVLPLGINRDDSWDDLEAKFGENQIADFRSGFNYKQYSHVVSDLFRIHVNFTRDNTTITDISYSPIPLVELSSACFSLGIDAEKSTNTQAISALVFNEQLSKIIDTAPYDFSGVDELKLEDISGVRTADSKLEFSLQKTTSLEQAMVHFEMYRNVINGLAARCCSFTNKSSYADDDYAEGWYVTSVRDYFNDDLEKLQLLLRVTVDQEENYYVDFSLWNKDN